MQYPRSSGILLHPTSLPGRYGIGDLGDMAYRFVDWLAEAGQSIWQTLPLGPTSYGDSPYQSLSAFAGNPLLISLDTLVKIGWLKPEDVAKVPDFDERRIQYGPVIEYHNRLLTLAYQRFTSKASMATKAEFKAWRDENAGWLDDFTLFVALKDANDGKAWVDWPSGQALRQEKAIAEARRELSVRIDEHAFRQWVFFQQWQALKTYANSKGIRLVGDIPIFVAHDSSDVWGNRSLFYLDKNGNPTVIAGVPPDYFSATGQRWGNPLYRWDVLAKDNYNWWIRRFKAMLSLVDIIRIDHFRGFEAYWEVPASEETAVNGRWVPGPDHQFFEAVRDQLGELPIIAEDLGVMTPGVESLRDDFNLPGMKVLQFAFDDECSDSPHMLHNFVPNSLVYTGTHDNNTTLGWWRDVSKQLHRCAERYLGHPITRPHWDLIRMAMMSVSHTAIFPLQDILGYGGNARMNLPGAASGNWGWRFTVDAFDNPGHDRLTKWTRLYARWPKRPEDEPSTEAETETEEQVEADSDTT